MAVGITANGSCFNLMRW